MGLVIPQSTTALLLRLAIASSASLSYPGAEPGGLSLHNNGGLLQPPLRYPPYMMQQPNKKGDEEERIEGECTTSRTEAAGCNGTPRGTEQEMMRR